MKMIDPQKKYMQFPLLAYSGQVKEITCPEVNDAHNPRQTAG